MIWLIILLVILLIVRWRLPMDATVKLILDIACIVLAIFLLVLVLQMVLGFGPLFRYPR